MSADQGALFYNNPQVLRFEDHRDLVLDRKQDFLFAEKANAIPLTPGEFPVASRYYPIVFVRSGDGFSAVAVTGLKQNRNLFVDEKGQWRAKTYIPAYVRRYPFILIQSEDKTRTVLGFDAGSQRIQPFSGNKDGLPLFAEDGTAGEGARPVMELCNVYHRQSLVGEEFVKAIQGQGLLEDKHVDMTFPDSSHYRLNGLMTVNADRYRALPADVLHEWHRKGFTDAIVSHLASAQSWQFLLELQEQALNSRAA